MSSCYVHLGLFVWSKSVTRRFWGFGGCRECFAKKWLFKVQCLSSLCKKKERKWSRSVVTPWTVAHQVPPSMEFPRQEYWMGCHFLLQEIFPTLKETTRQGRSRVTVKIAAGASVACPWFGDSRWLGRCGKKELPVETGTCPLLQIC